LTAGLSWRWVFFINLPIGIALLTAASAYLVPAAPAQRRPLDVPGALTATLGATALVYGISRATSDGWGSPAVAASLAVTAVAYAAFVLIELRSAYPLVHFGIFRHRNLRLGEWPVHRRQTCHRARLAGRLICHWTQMPNGSRRHAPRARRVHSPISQRSMAAAGRPFMPTLE
jgi:hypothetical protein